MVLPSPVGESVAANLTQGESPSPAFTSTPRGFLLSAIVCTNGMQWPVIHEHEAIVLAFSLPTFVRMLFPTLPSKRRAPIRFDRNEVAGAFGDLGTDLPLLIGVIAASGIDSASVLILFGLMQVFTGFWYRMPMPVQPLKAFAALVIAQKIPGRVIFGGGMAIGISLDWLCS
jgi:hypothetical protein